jgi:hypothetical protein
MQIICADKSHDVDDEAWRKIIKEREGIMENVPEQTLGIVRNDPRPDGHAKAKACITFNISISES